MPHHDPEKVQSPGSNTAWLRQAVTTSRLLSSLRNVTRASGWWTPSETNGFARGLTPRAAESDFALVTELVTRSRLVAGVTSIFALVADISREATVWRVWNESLSAIRGLARWQRVRLLGWLLATATLTHLLLASGDLVESRGTMLVVPAAALLAAVGLLWGSHALASAWEQRRIGRPGAE
jgi:hypothetical protein